MNAALARARSALTGGAGLAELRAAVGEVLRAVHDAPHTASAVWHPLGCFYLDLHRDAHESVRVHVWGCDGPRADAAGLGVHAHDFDVASCVLAGVLEHSRHAAVAVASSGADTHRRYRIDYRSDSVNILHAEPGPATFRCVERTLLRGGDRFEVRAGHFHSVRWAGGGPAVTFLTGRRQAGHRSVVLGPLAGPDQYRTERRPCPPDAVRRVLRQAIAGLGASRASL